MPPSPAGFGGQHRVQAVPTIAQDPLAHERLTGRAEDLGGPAAGHCLVGVHQVGVDRSGRRHTERRHRGQTAHQIGDVARHIHPGSLGRTARLARDIGAHTHGVLHRVGSQAGQDLAARHEPWRHHQRVHGGTPA
ncbi:hypothetical protein ACIREE_30050 [Streptomyces sp. NPDC102467]|uniref:hypothetical protein n=1 Tax=Streptomyces sp. NPDC102467 TaxID=3366179 RepID=UPI00382A9536